MCMCKDSLTCGKGTNKTKFLRLLAGSRNLQVTMQNYNLTLIN